MNSLLALLAPGEVGEVNEAVNAALQADEHAEVRDRLDLALDAVTLLVGLIELFPRIDLALLHAEADAATLFVDIENHDLDLIA